MQSLTCLLIDDEPLLRAQLRFLLEQEPGVVVVGEAGRKQEALDRIAELQPQLLFLDIQMPGGGGFDLLAGLDAPPAVVFVTAHEEHALRAFDVSAMDYLLKPVDPSRLHASIAKVQRALATPATPAADLTLIPLGQSGHFAEARQIIFIQADGHYCQLILEEGNRQFIRRGIRSWADVLPVPMFFQLDRSLIINRERIISCNFGLRSAELWLDDLTTPLVLGAVAAKRLRKLLSAGSSGTKP